jgi:hypothetical protein
MVARLEGLHPSGLVRDADETPNSDPAFGRERPIAFFERVPTEGVEDELTPHHL